MKHTRQLASSLLTEAIRYRSSAIIHLSFSNKEQHDKCMAISDALRECARKLKEVYTNEKKTGL